MRQKLHFIMAPLFILLLASIYMGDEKSKANATIEIKQKNSPFFIQIDNATWGANCDGYITPKTKNKDGTITYPRSIEVRTNNKLKKISKLCNNKAACVFGEANFEPVDTERCHKHLTIGYRCFRIDSLRTLKATSAKKVIIDCREVTVKKDPEEELAKK